MTRSQERGAVRKPRGKAIPVALVYPNSYRVGMGNLGFQHVYHVMNAHPLIAAERFFVPDPPDSRKPESRILSEETGRPLRDYPLIAFSVPFENDYPYVPYMLRASGIPPLRKDRTRGDPLVIAGGVSVSMNPEPLAEFLDMAFIGEIPDETVQENGLASAIADLFTNGIPDAREFREVFRTVPGAYVPEAYHYRFRNDGSIEEIVVESGFPERVAAVKRRGKESSVPVSVLFSPEAEFGNDLLIETNRGCGRGCRFCASGWIHLPVRYAELTPLKNQIDEALATGKGIGLVGSDLAGHPRLKHMLRTIVDAGGRFSLSSIRPEGVSREIAELMARTGQKTATLAPETASPRLKSVIGKEIPSERFLELVELLVSAGIPNIRFYFMIGLPTETDEDVDFISDFVLECRKVFVEASKPLKRIGTIAVQVNPFVPKPWTPFQWAAMAPVSVLKKRIDSLRKALAKVPNVVLRQESVRDARIQAILSRGDRRIADMLLAESSERPVMKNIGRGTELDFLAFRERESGEIFPWDTVDHGISKTKLYRVYEKALLPQIKR
ncbi:radical SAM protein [Desulfomonile tiedjei]|uniref:Fe-S oxidoreductase n=1 Tax=Desulfomonile tiedjei (strain ATCC 49306 / DSM 6799 / DCB-1) TaxID=706587 RepID=I4CCG4_DESTA|nr:radical SAM protein [Desulfomonile tiedjei]AFM27255.1 Fe-S oxidoreductase [Desulfomonile tiedjei DSM 6799]